MAVRVLLQGMTVDANARYQNGKVSVSDRVHLPTKKTAGAKKEIGNVHDHVLVSVTPKNSVPGPATGAYPPTLLAPELDPARTSTANAHGHVVSKPGFAAVSGAENDQISPRLGQ